MSSRVSRNMAKSDLIGFLKSQRVLAIATQGKGELWIANVFMGADDDGRIYFISNEETKHSEHILENGQVAFSAAWFKEGDHLDRKGVQGVGTCRIAISDDEISMGVQLHNENYPEFTERITVDWIRSEENKSRVWVIDSIFIKYWDDALLGQDGTEEFSFSESQM